MQDSHYSRQMNLISPLNLRMPITVIGAGSIGSWTVLALSKMGASNVWVYDGDVVEDVNIGSQLYTDGDIDLMKVDALSSKMVLLANAYISTREFYWSPEETVSEGIIIAAVDNMTTRSELYMTHKGKDLWLIDGRMAANEINIYAFKLNDEARCSDYEDTLFSDEEAEVIGCSERSVMYNTFTCGGLIASLVARIVNNQPVKFETIVDLMNMTMG